MFKGQKDRSINRRPIRSRRGQGLFIVGLLFVVTGLVIPGNAQQNNVEVVVWDTGPSIQGDDGALVSISGPASYDFYAGPDENQENPHFLYLPPGDYSFTVTAVWPQQSNIDGTSDRCNRRGRCKDNDIATFYIDFRSYSTQPNASDDSEITQEDTPVDISVMSNDEASLRITLDGSTDSSAAFVTETLRRTTGPGLCCGDLGYPESQTFDLTVEGTSGELDIVWVSNPSHGTASANADGTITYTPDDDYCGLDEFQYTIEDANGTDTATVRIEIQCVSDAPIAADDSASTDENSFVSIDITANDADPDGEIDASTVIIVDAPSKGSLDIASSSGIVTYTPDAGACGSDAFTYTVSDFDGTSSNEARVDIDIACNLPPRAEDDDATTDENSSVGISILSNDSDSDGTLDATSVNIITAPASGELSIHPSTGVITYSPESSACGSDMFTYTVQDDDGAHSNEAVVSIEILCDDPPLAIDDLYSVDEGGTLSVAAPGILSNDETSPWEPLSAILESDVSHGSLTLRSDGSFVYVHDGSETTSDTFRYRGNDGTEDSNRATVTLVIVPVNDPPTATEDVGETDEDEPVTLSVLDNDSDPDGDELSVDWISPPSHGSVRNEGNAITYIPDPDYHGTDSFTYGVSDGNGGSDTADVAISISPQNDPPVAQNDSEGTDEDVPVMIRVLDNDTDVDGDRLSIQSVNQPSHGVVDIRGDEIRYEPDSDFHGTDQFEYTVSDGQGGTSTATVTVFIAPVNDPPVATNDSAETEEDQAVAIDLLRNDSDPDGDALDIEAVTQPSHGVLENRGVEVVYTPDADYNGPDSFTYTISDGNGGTDHAEATIRVRPGNDPPIARDDSASTEEDIGVSINVLVNDEDIDGDTLTIIETSDPAHGVLTLAGESIRYQPNPDFAGLDEFTYTIADEDDETATAIVSLLVAPVNDPPRAENDEASTSEDTSVDVFLLNNDGDPDGDLLIIQSVTQPSNGSVTNHGNHVTYLPHVNYHGTDTFTYTVSDGHGGTATAEVRIDIASENDPPLAQDDSGVTEEGVPVRLDLLANDSDADGDALTIQSIDQPSNGTVVNHGDDITYTPQGDFNGIDSFTYIVSDGQGGMDTATVTLSVAAVNDPPEAIDDRSQTPEDVPVTIDVLDNDSDPDGDALSIQSITQPAYGTAVIVGEGIRYTPNADTYGEDAFTYTVTDGNGSMATATVEIDVSPTNDPPVAQDDSTSTNEGAAVTIDVLANDSDPDGDTLAVLSVESPGHGSLQNNGSDVVYTPDANYNGIDQFTYTLSDGNGGTNTATVTIAIAAVNDPPNAENDDATTDEDTALTISVLDNDSDPDGDALSIQSATQPEQGSVFNTGSDLVYTPNSNVHGNDAFTYTVSDGFGGTDTASVTVTILPINDPPVAQDDSSSTDEGVSVAIPVLDNDSDLDGDALILQSVDDPLHGSATLSGSSIVYLPDEDYDGTDAFTYTVTDEQGGTDTATVTVFVVPRNDPPIAVNDEASTGEDVALSIHVLSNDSDPDGDSLSIESVTQPDHGTTVRSGSSILYTPDPNYSGPDSFAYTLIDGNGGSDTATVTMTVLETNDPPFAQEDSMTLSEKQTTTVSVLDNDSDPDGDPLRIESIERPSGGVVENLGSALTYTPNPGFTGLDTFAYTVSDGNGKTSRALVTILVVPINDAPVAQDDSATTDEDTLVTISVLSNDSDADGDFLLVESFSQPRNGSVLSSRTGLSYIPDEGFQGVDSFTYIVSDGNGGSDSATVTVSVAGVNDAPLAEDNSAITDEGLAVRIPVLLNDSDPDDDVLAIQSVTVPENGTAIIENGDIVYTPFPGFDGVDQFSYTVTDPLGGTDTALVFVAVAAVNDPPVAQNDSTAIRAGQSATIPVLDNDTDPEGEALQIIAVEQPANGSVEIAGSTLFYAPNAGFVGTDSFAYTIEDAEGATSRATVTVGVDPLIAGAGGATAADCEGRIIISELAWAGTAADARDEWIELRNLSAQPIDLAGWTIQWRASHPATPDEQRWKIVELSGIMEAAPIAACEIDPSSTPTVSYAPDASGAWLVTAPPVRTERGFFTLERRSDNTVRGQSANLVYDTGRTLGLALSDRGEIVMLLNPDGEVVDSANASNLGRNGWAAGNAATFGTMERIDPLGPDVEENWQTNLGLAITGLDADEHPLRATPGAANSPRIDAQSLPESITASTIRKGELVSVSFALSRQARRNTGWPWISVSRPGFAAGAGGSDSFARYSFSGQHEGSSSYQLSIGSGDLVPGSYNFWIVYGNGRAVIVPIIVSP